MDQPGQARPLGPARDGRRAELDVVAGAARRSRPGVVGAPAQLPGRWRLGHLLVHHRPRGRRAAGKTAPDHGPRGAHRAAAADRPPEAGARAGRPAHLPPAGDLCLARQQDRLRALADPRLLALVPGSQLEAALSHRRARPHPSLRAGAASPPTIFRRSPPCPLPNACCTASSASLARA
ncbi:hypothetical protein CBM2592_A210074 [Cupriavidus taiwanensis]|nr:hypothetical protein CBM2592_A210074 [Cupriavidus taiwanensis]SOY83272.1 hypothetical protein CBM2591_A250075 [Cupriavidus taiwanensis]SOZ57277.1 hypothetical protein CBM2617_A230074 [Cupriavidus taiwanensis]SOZ79296.1 hypothetical protein CBM2618_A210073 [Cupriavidus taiwanensis]SOZ79870.1 hypothetical protein CBM2622_A200072 [Cupriavidus taiwanensis]